MRFSLPVLRAASALVHDPLASLARLRASACSSPALSRKLSLKSSQGGYKVAIIWLPERMNLTSANKLLKLLEEPPSQTVFILVSEEPAYT